MYLTHSTLYTCTCSPLVYRYDLYHSKPQNFQEEATRQLVGTVVVTRYNNRTYRIDDIAWNKNPKSTFTDHTDKSVSFVEYYKLVNNSSVEHFSDCFMSLLIIIHFFVESGLRITKTFKIRNSHYCYTDRDRRECQKKMASNKRYSHIVCNKTPCTSYIYLFITHLLNMYLFITFYCLFIAT